MADVPEEAVTAAQMADGDAIHRWTGGLSDDRVRRMLQAAAPHLLAAEVSARRAEQDAVHADLSQLLRVLGGCRCKNPKGKCGCCDESRSEWYADIEGDGNG
jgi:hypothetical protein